MNQRWCENDVHLHPLRYVQDIASLSTWAGHTTPEAKYVSANSRYCRLSKMFLEANSDNR
jgi:hypothetical protein